jgi:hypothetical protein
MTTRQSDVLCPATDSTHAVKRRGLLTAIWAAAAAFVVRATTQPVAGANGDPVIAGSQTNVASDETWLRYTGTGRGFFGYASGGSAGVAVQGWCDGPTGTGVLGNSENSTGSSFGVRGTASSPAGTGVSGLVFSTTGSTIGVRGESRSPAGFAVYGKNTSGGTVMLGELPGTTNQNGIALYGLNNSSYTGPGPGAGGFAVYGLSAKGHGLVGATAAAGAAAVVGATNGVAGAYAAAFYGPVIVGGDFTVVGGAKSAAVPHPDGSHRRLYCLESPESWFEDFGKGRLECGEATVQIDPDFAAVADLNDYHVFVSGYDDFELRVTDQTATGFRVYAKDVASAGRFSWRVVAKRKDIAGPRLEPVTIPPEPTLPPVPDVPAAVEPPSPAGFAQPR